MGVRIGIRELREKLAEYSESSVPIEVTRHGQTVGFYIPVPRRPSQSERDALLEAGRRLQGELAKLGITEDELMADFQAWRRRHADQDLSFALKAPNAATRTALREADNLIQSRRARPAR